MSARLSRRLLPPGDLIYVSLADNDGWRCFGEAGDILGFYTGTNSWFSYFDATAPIDGSNVDAFLIFSNKLIMSFDTTVTAGAGSSNPATSFVQAQQQR